LPRTQVNGSMEREVARLLHDSILPYPPDYPGTIPSATGAPPAFSSRPAGTAASDGHGARQPYLVPGSRGGQNAGASK
jgi:hypothetical protein